MSLQDNIYKYRKEKGYSQEELGVLCHVSRQAVSKWENGSSKPDSDNLVLLAKYLEVTTDALLGIEEKKAESITAGSCEYREISYTSGLRLFNLPFIDVYFRIYQYHGFGYRIGFSGGSRCAKGIIAVGVRAMGVFTLSIFGVGLFGIGLFNIGLLASAGLCSASLFYALGIFSISLYFACGVIAISSYAFGVLAVGMRAAVGVAAFGNHAIGILAEGAHRYLMRDGASCIMDPLQFQQMQMLLQDAYMPALMRALISHLPLC